MAEQVIFYILAIAIAVFSIMAVTSKLVVRSATYLLFVLIATAGLYLLLNYHFLFAVQIAVYAGGIMVLFIMAIFLTHKPGRNMRRQANWKVKLSVLLSATGLLFCAYIIINNITKAYSYTKGDEIQMQDIGTAMMGSGKYQYLLTFEVISVLLLACIVGAILIARKENTEEENNNSEQ
jgi:NADH:ubiquinone oxidoreductase subunit 6 (chain J)